MFRKTWVGSLIVLLALALPAAGAMKTVQKKDLPVMSSDGAEWYSTGIGAETRDVAVKGFPLKLIFATGKGELLANVDVRLVKDGQTVLEAKGTGPWLFVKVPAGAYDLEAEVGGKKAVRKGIRVPERGASIVTVHWAMK